MLYQQAESCLLFIVYYAQDQQGRLEALWPGDCKSRITVSCIFKKHFHSKYVWGCVHAVEWNEPRLWTQTDLDLASSITGYVTWDKLLHFSESVFSSVRQE